MFLERETLHLAALPALASALVLLSGTTALREADPSGHVKDLFAGTYQRTYDDRFEEALPFRTFAQQSWTALRLAAFQEAHTGALVGQDGWLFTLEEFTTPQDAPDFSREVKDARDQLAKRGITLIPVIVPDKARIMAKRQDFLRDAEIETRYNRTLAVLAAIGLPALDVRAPLQMLDDAAFLRTDTHWSAEGAQATAQIIANQMPNLMGDIGSYQTQAIGNSTLEGDLLAFVDTGPFQSWVGPAAETVTLYETTPQTNDLGLFDTPKINVALVGTSFSARPDLHFDGFLKSALGQDVLNMAEEGLGPFEPMRRFLASPILSSNPPTTVIWEIPERYINSRTLP